MVPILGDPGAVKRDDRVFVVTVYYKNFPEMVNCHHKQSIVPTNCPWVSEDGWPRGNRAFLDTWSKRWGVRVSLHIHSAFSFPKAPTGFQLGIPIKTCSNNRKIECSLARGTMGRRKRREKASLLSFNFPSCHARFLFLSPPPPPPPPQPPYNTGGSGGSLPRRGSLILGVRHAFLPHLGGRNA